MKIYTLQISGSINDATWSTIVTASTDSEARDRAVMLLRNSEIASAARRARLWTQDDKPVHVAEWEIERQTTFQRVNRT